MLAVAFLAGIEVAFLAIVQMDCLFSAKVALSFSLKVPQFERMLIVASLKRNGSAFTAIAFSILVAEHAYQLYAFLLFADNTKFVEIL
jgi:hypothetical protein